MVASKIFEDTKTQLTALHKVVKDTFLKKSQSSNLFLQTNNFGRFKSAFSLVYFVKSENEVL